MNIVSTIVVIVVTIVTTTIAARKDVLCTLLLLILRTLFSTKNCPNFFSEAQRMVAAPGHYSGLGCRIQGRTSVI